MINILVLNSDTDGVGYHRLLAPYLQMNDSNFRVEVRLLMDYTLNLNEEFLKDYNIIVYNKNIPFSSPQMEMMFNAVIKKYNIKLVYDIDDHWILDSSHINYKNWKESNAKDTILKSIQTADLVTTPSSIFAKDILEYNKNVEVLPNAVNLDENQWDYTKKNKSEKLRFLWGGGISHLPDIRLFKDSFKEFDKEFLNKCQLYLCGFDLRIKTKNGMMKDDWHRSTWTFFEDIFTNNHRYITNAEYRQWLITFDNTNIDLYGYNEKYKDEFYQRRWTKPILLYGTQYRDADVCLAPLKDGFLFNKVKSGLKIVEAGAYKCPLIASNTGPYTLDDIEGKTDGKQKGFLIDVNNNMEWSKKMKWYKDNPNAVIDHGETNYEYVKENYEVNKVNEKRMQIFINLVNK
jgi:glycosyltransferase involved in cell wall biosynthesis